MLDDALVVDLPSSCKPWSWSPLSMLPVFAIAVTRQPIQPIAQAPVHADNGKRMGRDDVGAGGYV